MTSPSRPAAEHTEDQIVGELKSLSVMERSRRYGVVNSPTGLLAPIGKRRLPSPCSPDSALGSDDENGKSARNNDRTLNRGTDSAENADEDDDEEEEPDDIVCDGIREEPKARTLRTPSVVISDHSDDPFMATSTLTLDEIERIRAEYESDPIRRRSSSANNTGGDSGSDCSATSSWSSWGLDPDYALRSQRKTSDCSTCSTLSGEDDDTLQPVILQQVKVKKMDRPPPGSPVPRPRSLMENLLIAKMERAGLCPAPLLRMDSTDSASSFASTSSLGSEVCRCDDCLLGIADLHLPSQDSKKKVYKEDGQMTGGSRRSDRRSPSPRSPPLAAPGYEQYSKSLLDVPYSCVEYGEASSDDLSSEWDSDVPEPPQKPSGWRKLRNIVQWTPFFQTYKKQRYPWVQLAGHQGNFKAGPEPGTILKKLCPKEQLCFQILMKDILRPYVPEYKGHVTCDDGDGSSMYLQLQDLLGDFTNPCVMDCKIGVRTYLEEELAKAKEKPKLRKDMYEKMIQIDSNAPTEEEHRLKGVTKPRYMVWRETISSTATLGFRIEGIKKSDGKSSKDFKTTRTQGQIKEAFKDFADGFPHAVPKYIQRLKAIKATLEVSTFFHTHEMIGSSLLFVHDQKNANVWLIDFAKTLELPKKINIDHASSWVVGNHEDGYLIGINNLINIFSELNAEMQQATVSTTLVVTAPTDIDNESTSIVQNSPQLSDQINNSHEVT